MEEYKLTRKGYEEKQERLNYLLEVAQPENVKALQEARAQGDLSENADYDAAKRKQGEINAEIDELRNILGNVVIIDESARTDGSIAIGATVSFTTVKDKKEFEFQIVGSQEADPFKGKISDDSVIAKSIIGHKTGDVVMIHVEKPYELKITKVTYGKN